MSEGGLSGCRDKFGNMVSSGQKTSFSSLNPKGFRRAFCHQEAHQMGSTAEQWALEFLLDQDGLSEGIVRELYEHLSGGGEPLSKTIQARLLLRVLREHAANISEATLNALNCLAATSSDIKSHYSPHANLQNLLPSLDLYLLVRTR